MSIKHFTTTCLVYSWCLSFLLSGIMIKPDFRSVLRCHGIQHWGLVRAMRMFPTRDGG